MPQIGGQRAYYAEMEPSAEAVAAASAAAALVGTGSSSSASASASDDELEGNKRRRLLEDKDEDMVDEADNRGKGGGGGSETTETDEDDDSSKGSSRVRRAVAAAVTSSAGAATTTSPEDADGDAKASNLFGVEPTVGMPLEIRDTDGIWSSATIVAIQDNNDDDRQRKRPRCTVTIRFDGWGPDWDEDLPYPHPRLARIFTYTKKVRCFVDLIPKKKQTGNGKNFSNLWPCAVRFRMPDPGSELDRQERARDLLRQEVNVFVQPYGPDLLPKYIEAKLANGGIWLNAKNKLRPWRDDVEDMPLLHPTFKTAHGTFGMADAHRTKGVLPPKAVEAGSLLSEWYRVRNVGGDTDDAVGEGREFYTGAFRAPPPKAVSSRGGSSSASSSRRGSSASSTMACSGGRGEGGCSGCKGCSNAPTLPLAGRIGVAADEHRDPYALPPTLPPAIKIREEAYPNSGVVRLEKSKQWSASVTMGGNDVFLGAFPSQTQAMVATKVALGEPPSSGIGVHPAGQGNVSDKMQMDDLRAVRFDSIVAAAAAAQQQNQWDPSRDNFSLHEWTVHLLNHRVYLEELHNGKVAGGGEGANGARDGQMTSTAPLDGSQRKIKRKQRKPRRVDLQRHSYV